MAKKAPALNKWQRRCLAQLKASASQLPDTLRILDSGTVDDESSTLHVSFALTTSEIGTAPGGLPLQDEERFILAIGRTDERPPAVYVDHFRFLGHPHVLAGFQFCLYLDESREWDPEQGINGIPNGVLNRLWRWLAKAANAQFNPNEALYHAVGGLPHLSRTGVPLPPIVIRDLPPRHGRVASAWLTRRADWCLRLDVTRPDADESELMPVFFTDKDLPFGAGRDYLYELTTRLDLQQRDEPVGAVTIEHSSLSESSRITRTKCAVQGCTIRPSYARVVPKFAHNSQAVTMLTALAASASRKPAGTPQTLLLAVPHPVGGPRHLIAVYFEAALADHLRHLVATRTGPILTFDKARLDRATPLKWCYVSDERKEVTKRRDIGRPVIAYQGKNVLIWGVGGLGSWIAEYITRAGANREDPEPGDEFVPTRGCSLPTFHGSAADLAAVAASLTNLIAPHLTDNASGTHLFALPHSGVTPPYQYIRHEDPVLGAN